jgi:hypothetical protein
MKRERALKIVLMLVGLLFTAIIYPLVLFVKQEPALAMMMSLYVALGIFLEWKLFFGKRVENDFRNAGYEDVIAGEVKQARAHGLSFAEVDHQAAAARHLHSQHDRFRLVIAEKYSVSPH